MTNRRLIAMIRGRATAGDPLDLASLAARPQIVSALSRCTVAIGAAGVAVVLASGLGGGLISAAAGAAATQGGLSGSGRPAADAVSGLAASPPVEGEVQGIGGTGTHTSLPAPLATPALQGIVAPTATPAPTPTPAPAVPAVVMAPPAPGTVEAIIVEVFGAHGQEAIGVANCESHLHPTSVSRGGGNWGLFQINRAHAQRVANMGFRWEDLLDARVNAIVAKSIFDEQGWRPWACRGAAR